MTNTSANSRTRRRAEPTAEERNRHQAMVRLVFDWLARTRATQQKLVECINEFWRSRGDSGYRCDHTLLSRILNPGDPHVPTAHRPRSAKIMQAAMVICARADDPNIIADAADDDRRWVSDEEHLFKVHRARLRRLRDSGRQTLFQSLTLLGEFVAGARTMDEAFRARACENTLMTLAALADAGVGRLGVAGRLRSEGVDDAAAQEIQRRQIQRIDQLLEATAEPTVNMRAYAGAALFFCDQAERGMRMLLDAVAQCHDAAQRHDPHWETLLELLDRALENQDADAPRWSKEAAQVAIQCLDDRANPGRAELLRHAWQSINVPRLREHWQQAASSVLERLDATTPPASPVKRAMGALVLALGLLLPGVIGAPAPADGHTVRTPAPTVQLSIRGREASTPAPPPNGGGNSTASA